MSRTALALLGAGATGLHTLPPRRRNGERRRSVDGAAQSRGRPPAAWRLTAVGLTALVATAALAADRRRSPCNWPRAWKEIRRLLES